MSEAPLRRHAVRIDVTDDDLPEDRFNDHVNNARYFAFINRCFHSWYVAMGMREGSPPQVAVMAHLEYDFLREVKPPSVVAVRIEVIRVGRTSLDHAIEIDDLGRDGAGPVVLAGRGRAVHVWVDRANGRSAPWPPHILALCARG